MKKSVHDYNDNKKAKLTPYEMMFYSNLSGAVFAIIWYDICVRLSRSEERHREKRENPLTWLTRAHMPAYVIYLRLASKNYLHV